MNKVIFDIGSNEGEDTEYYLARGYKVVAFECSPKNIKLLKNKFKDQIFKEQLKIEERALFSGGGKNKKINFYESNFSTWGTTKQKWDERNKKLGGQSKKIYVDTLDPKDIYELYNFPFYMKIDIEGADMEVLSSLKILNKKNLPLFLSIESEKVSWNKLIKEMNLFKSLGYKKFKIIGQYNNRFKVT